MPIFDIFTQNAQHLPRERSKVDFRGVFEGRFFAKLQKNSKKAEGVNLRLKKSKKIKRLMFLRKQ